MGGGGRRWEAGGGGRSCGEGYCSVYHKLICSAAHCALTVGETLRDEGKRERERIGREREREREGERDRESRRGRERCREVERSMSILKLQKMLLALLTQRTFLHVFFNRHTWALSAHPPTHSLPPKRDLVYSNSFPFTFHTSLKPAPRFVQIPCAVLFSLETWIFSFSRKC